MLLGVEFIFTNNRFGGHVLTNLLSQLKYTKHTPI